MKLLMMVKSFQPIIGGVETAVYELARGLSKKYSITILTVSEDKNFRREEKDGFEVIKTPRFAKILSTPLSINYPFGVKKIINSADIIHLHSPHPIGEFSLLIFPPPKKLLITFHFDIAKQKYLNFIYQPLVKSLFEKSERIVFSNPNIINSSNILSNFSAKCVQIPYGITIDKYVLNDKDKLIVKKMKEKYHRPVILFVGRLVYYKGVQYLIKAMQKVDANCIIIGDGPLKKSLMKMVDKLCLSDRIEFKPHLPHNELLLNFSMSDIFVLPSVARAEAFGMVLLEAMTYGKPLVTTELGTGTSYININGKTGFVVPPSDAEALSRAINALISDETTRRSMGENAVKRVREAFNIEKYLLEYDKLYQQVLVG